MTYHTQAPFGRHLIVTKLRPRPSVCVEEPRLLHRRPAGGNKKAAYSGSPFSVKRGESWKVFRSRFVMWLATLRLLDLFHAKKNEEFRVLSTLRSPMCASVRDSSRALEIRYDTFI